MNDLERLEKRYDRRIWIILIGLVIGISGMTVSEVYRILGTELDRVMDLSISGVTMVGWLLVVAMLFSLSRANDSEMLASPVNDERVQENRWRAYQFAFNTVLIVQLVMMIAGAVLLKTTSFVPSLSLTANLTIGVGLFAALFRFQQLNR